MNILIVGGSNSGIANGWGKHFERLAAKHHVTNSFLGAVGSLYGLVNVTRILDVSKIDTIVLEYTLNDAIMMNYGVLSDMSLQICLDQLAEFCRINRIVLVFLMLNRRSDFPLTSTHTNIINNIYFEVAKRHNIATIFLADLIAKPPFCWTPVDVLFDAEGVHLSEPLAEEVAKSVLELVESQPAPPEIVPEFAFGLLSWARDRLFRGAGARARQSAELAPEITAPWPARSEFVYLGAADAKTWGDVRAVERKTPVFTGNFLRIGPEGGCRWKSAGQLAALLVNSREDSGWITIVSGDHLATKNTRSSWTRPNANHVSLQYMTKPINVENTSLEVYLGKHDKGRIDFTPETIEPTLSPMNQYIELHGVVLLSSLR